MRLKHASTPFISLNGGENVFVSLFKFFKGGENR